MMGMGAFGWWFHFIALFLPNQSSSALNSAVLTLRKRGDWPTIEAVKGCVLVLVRGCLGRVGCVFGGCWAVWRRCVFRACEGLLLWVGYGMCRMGGKGLIRRENAWVGLKVLLSASAGAGWGQYAVLWLQKGVLPAMTVANRRVADSFSLASRSIFVAFSFVFCLFLVRSSFGLR